jgi:hypothetical protein
MARSTFFSSSKYASSLFVRGSSIIQVRITSLNTGLSPHGTILTTRSENLGLPAPMAYSMQAWLKLPRKRPNTTGNRVWSVVFFLRSIP